MEFDVYQTRNLLRRLDPSRLDIPRRELTLAKILKRLYTWVVSARSEK